MGTIILILILIGALFIIHAIKKIIWAALIILALIGICGIKNTCTNNYANLRECPSVKTCKKIMTLNPNSRVEKTGNQEGNWIEVEYNGTRGYLSKELLSSCN